MREITEREPKHTTFFQSVRFDYKHDNTSKCNILYCLLKNFIAKPHQVDDGGSSLFKTILFFIYGVIFENKNCSHFVRQ